MQVRVERLAGGVNFLEAGLGERGLELLLDHHDAGLECGELVAFRVLRGGERHLKIVEDGQQFLDQGKICVLRGLDLFAGGALLEIVKIGGGAEQAFPVLIGLGGAGLEFLNLFRGKRGRHRRRGGGGFSLGQIGFGFAHGLFAFKHSDGQPSRRGLTRQRARHALLI